MGALANEKEPTSLSPPGSDKSLAIQPTSFSAVGHPDASRPVSNTNFSGGQVTHHSILSVSLTSEILTRTSFFPNPYVRPKTSLDQVSSSPDCPSATIYILAVNPSLPFRTWTLSTFLLHPINFLHSLSSNSHPVRKIPTKGCGQSNQDLII
ncbi:hypothetical protein H4Q26_010260 [Puccinia striiformis f. sp. tritici PST-130]|nr:hypothetical protein H4Q26_010260 [Puccinia striiformis f. sp. tritici PST-130]